MESISGGCAFYLIGGIRSLVSKMATCCWYRDAWGTIMVVWILRICPNRPWPWNICFYLSIWRGPIPCDICVSRQAKQTYLVALAIFITRVIVCYPDLLVIAFRNDRSSVHTTERGSSLCSKCVYLNIRGILILSRVYHPFPLQNFV